MLMASCSSWHQAPCMRTHMCTQADLVDSRRSDQIIIRFAAQSLTKHLSDAVLSTGSHTLHASSFSA